MAARAKAKKFGYNIKEAKPGMGAVEYLFQAEGAADSWATAPVYVGSERWGRGLDLDVSYVFLLAPPFRALRESESAAPLVVLEPGTRWLSQEHCPLRWSHLSSLSGTSVKMKCSSPL